MAQAGNKVVILDGDLRNPAVHTNFLLPNTVGLTSVLAENYPLKNAIMKSGIQGLDIISCGPKPPNPAELLNSEKMKNLLEILGDLYDYILIDTPPVVMMTDAALLASAADGTLLVVSSGEAIIDGASKAMELLKNVNANLLGVVLNKVKLDKSKDYFYKYRTLNNNNQNRIKGGKSNRPKKTAAYV
jgi:capsular exopolysaccharide synthesis family protein